MTRYFIFFGRIILFSYLLHLLRNYIVSVIFLCVHLVHLVNLGLTATILGELTNYAIVSI